MYAEHSHTSHLCVAPSLPPSLRGRPSANLMFGFNKWELKPEGGADTVALTPTSITRAQGSDFWSARVRIPQDAYELNFVLNDGQGAFENNAGQDFTFPVVGEWRMGGEAIGSVERLGKARAEKNCRTLFIKCLFRREVCPCALIPSQRSCFQLVVRVFSANSQIQGNDAESSPLPPLSGVRPPSLFPPPPSLFPHSPPPLQRASPGMTGWTVRGTGQPRWLPPRPPQTRPLQTRRSANARPR